MCISYIVISFAVRRIYSNNMFLRKILIPAMLLAVVTAKAQLTDKLYPSDYKIDKDNKGSLFIELDNLSFFKDNEYSGNVMKGYSLPGFWLQPKVVYYPLENIKLELGAHLLKYWGAQKYPYASYFDIPEWQGNDFQHGFHALPWLRAQMDFSDNFSVILGNIYGASNHRLIEPLYNPELNQTADPEAGAQILYSSKYFDLDFWGSWDSFIFRNDVHQESFTVGLSTRAKWNEPEKELHFYTNLQLLARHYGGEIDTITTNSVQTLMNGALGIGTEWNASRKYLKKAGLEVDVLGYYQQAGKMWQLDSGYAIYSSAFTDIKNVRLKAGYMWNNDFISMYGSPFFGSVSTKQPGGVFDNPQLVHWGLEYTRSFGKYFSFGADLSVYHCFGGTFIVDGVVEKNKQSTSFSAGLYMRIKPSFLLFRKK